MGRAGTKFFMRKGEVNQKVIICTPCRPSPDQDARYGKHHRLANRMADLLKTKRYRCTVCGTPHSFG